MSLLPFRLQPVGPDHAWASFFEAMTAWPRRVPRTNFVANVLLFVPIGFGLCGVNNLLAGFGLAVPLGIVAPLASGDRRWPWRLVAAAWLAGAGAVFSVSEAGQFFVPSRIPDSIGVMLGIVAVGLGPWIGRWLERSAGVGAGASAPTVATLFPPEP